MSRASGTHAAATAMRDVNPLDLMETIRAGGHAITLISPHRLNV